MQSIAQWLIIGILVSMSITDNTDKEVIIPCFVGDKFISGSSGCAVNTTARYCTVKMTRSNNVLKYDGCTMHDVYANKMYSGRNINGIVGLIKK